jgi:hypothetical protein
VTPLHERGAAEPKRVLGVLQGDAVSIALRQQLREYVPCGREAGRALLGRLVLPACEQLTKRLGRLG